MPQEDFSFFDVDPTRLDQEWVEQPKLYFRYARKVAELQGAVEQAKAAIDVVEAECSSRVRANPERFKVAKVTDKAVSERVYQMAEYQEAVLEYQRLRKALDVYKAAVTALDHRKRALENLVKLWLGEYYSNPRVEGGANLPEKITTGRGRSKARKEVPIDDDSDDES
jgi:hypothetical protein